MSLCEKFTSRKKVKELEGQVAILESQIPVPPPQRVDIGTLDTSTIADKLVELWGMEYVTLGHAKIIVGNFQATTIDCLMDFVRWAGIDKLQYTPFHLCGDYALGLMGRMLNTPGWWGTPLGYLEVLFPKSQEWHGITPVFAYPDASSNIAAYFIEPQTAKLITYDRVANLPPFNPEMDFDSMHETGAVGMLLMT